MYVNEELYNTVLRLYFDWKELNANLKAIYSRGINFHEAFSEYIVCYVNGYRHSLGEGSEDAFDENNAQVQIKGTSNFDRDLTSFGPTSEFEILEFARLNQDEDRLYLYRIPIDDLYDVQVNNNATFLDQQNAGRRPRFSIITRYIEREDIEHYAVVNLVDGTIDLM